MGLLDTVAARFGFYKKQQRNFTAASVNRLTAGWSASRNSADANLRYNLTLMRSRSRDLSDNNPYVKRYLQLLQTNVIGPVGINLQAKVLKANGKVDSDANNKIEKAWNLWCKKGGCDVTGLYSFKALQDIIMESIARDGEALIIKHTGSNLNQFGFALQLLEADHLDETYNFRMENGNEIRMGIEFNPWNKPVAYHLLTKHPGDYLTSAPVGQRRERIPAERVLHIYRPDRALQSRGVPWLVASMSRLNMLGGIEEAHLVGTRASAAKMGFITSPDGGDNYLADGKDESGNIVQEMEPGMIELLPSGYDFKPFDTTFPNASLPDFTKHMLRGIAADGGVSYHALANDLTEVNYSSIRQGSIEERDFYRTIQRFIAEQLCQPVFDSWLDMALLTGSINLPAAKVVQFNCVRWQFRGWDWVDPLKDIKASETELANGLTTRTAIAAEQGLDIEDIFAELAREKELASQYGIKLIDPLPSGAKVVEQPPAAA